MYLASDVITIRQAKAAHELFMVNLLLFHLLMTPAAIVLGIGLWGLLLPLLLSLGVIAYSYLRSRQLLRAAPLRMLHWQLAMRRYRLLLIGYAVTALILLLGFLLSLGMQDENMREIILTVITRIGVVPLLLLVFILAFLESSALSMAGNQEVPDSLYAEYFSAAPEGESHA